MTIEKELDDIERKHQERSERIFAIAPELRSDYEIKRIDEDAYALITNLGFAFRDYLYKEASRAAEQNGKNVVNAEDVMEAYAGLLNRVEREDEP